MTLFEVAQEIARRLSGTFLRDADGRRPVYGGTREVPGRSALARPDPVLRVLPRRQRRRAGRQPPDRVDRRWSRRCWICSARIDAKAALETEHASGAPDRERSSHDLGAGRRRVRVGIPDDGRAIPSLYQINTRVWLTELSRTLGRRATLDDIPDAELDRLSPHRGLRLDLVAERLADRPGGAAHLSDAIRSGVVNSRRRCRT